MKRFSPYLGASGLGFLLAGLLLSIMQPGRDRLWAAILIAGLSLIVLYLVNNWQEVLRFTGRRSAREGAGALVLVLLVVGIAVAINFIANRHSKKWDFTAARQYTLSDQTTKVLSELDTDVEIVLLDNPASSNAVAARDLLELYDEASERVTFEIVDPDAQPEKALSYQEPGESGVTMGGVLVVARDRKERATAATEPEITNALLRALGSKRKKIYFTSGHQEKSLDETEPNAGLSVIKRKLEASTYETDTLLVARSVEGGEMRIPADADAVVVAGPRSDFLPNEIGALDRYLASSGKAVFLIDPTTQAETPGLIDFLRGKGAAIGDDIVVDPLSVPPLYPVVRTYGAHPIVESFGNAVSIFPLVRSVERSQDLPGGTEVRELFSSEAESWAETRLAELGSREGPAPDQKRGPLSLAVAVTAGSGSEGEAKTGNGEEGKHEDAPSTESARWVVVGDSDFIANELASAPVLNPDLFLNMVNWVAQDEDLISIRPREAEDRRIFLSPQQTTNILLLSLLIIPGAILVTGLSVWWGRR